MSEAQSACHTVDIHTFIDNKKVTLDMAKEYFEVLLEDHEPFEEEFLEKNLPSVILGNDDSILAITTINKLDLRLKEIISIHPDLDFYYKEPLLKALYKQAISKLSDRIEYKPMSYGLEANREFQMALKMLDVVSVSFFTHQFRMTPQELLCFENQAEVIEKIRIFVAGVIWTQSNVGFNVHQSAKTKADNVVEQIAEERVRKIKEKANS